MSNFQRFPLFVIFNSDPGEALYLIFKRLIIKHFSLR